MCSPCDFRRRQSHHEISFRTTEHIPASFESLQVNQSILHKWRLIEIFIQTVIIAAHQPIEPLGNHSQNHPRNTGKISFCSQSSICKNYLCFFCHHFCRNRPTNHVSKNVRPQTAYHSKNIIETPMVGRKKCNATSNPVKENTNTCGPVELIESDSSSESELTSTAVPTKISTNGIQLPKNSDNAKFAANIPKKSKSGSAIISSSVYSRNNQNSSERIACVVSNTANFSRNNQQSDEENDALPQMTRVNIENTNYAAIVMTMDIQLQLNFVSV